MKKLTFKLLLSAGLALAVTQALAAAGKIEFVTGEVKVRQAGGAEQVARKGMEVNEGDLVMSGKPGYAQIRFDDGGIAALQSSTVLRIEKFVYKQEDKSKDVVSLELLKGRLRAITGEVGSVHKENYRVRTPMAQMAVRGTDHETIFIAPDAGELAAGRAGSYNKVNVGGTTLQTESGRIDVNAGQTGFAADAKSGPGLLAKTPSLYLAGGADAPKRRFIQVDADGSSPPIVRVLVSIAGVGASSAQTGVTLPFDTAFAPPRDTGRNAELGVDWGRWETAAGSAHFINARNVTSASQLAALPGAGLITATYTYAGQGTKPTNEAGQIGSVVSATAIANFATNTLSGYTLSANTPGRTWNVSGSGTFAQFGSVNGIALTGFCGGCATAAATGRASGQFTGAAAQGLTSGYSVQSDNNAVAGVILMKRP